jgi:hypothetical protein
MDNEMSYSVPIRVDSLPEGLHWEIDGSCWECIKESGESKGWRWRPMNLKAFAKEAPEGEMTDFYPFNAGQELSRIT